MAAKTPKGASKGGPEAARQRFAAIEKPEVSLETFLELDRREDLRQQRLAAGLTQGYQRGLPSMTPCGNGDLEAGIDPNEWQGAYANKQLPLPTTGDPFAGFTAGLVPGLITDVAGGFGAAHQTWVGPGVDPKVGIPTTAPGSAGSVRIGNAVNQYGCELLSKTFTVTAAEKTIRFWYAVVLEDPQHDASIQPFFWVRVTETSSGAVIPGAVNLGGAGDRVVADRNNPFFVTHAGGSIVYKDWACAQINLATHVGKSVTVEFITADCGAGGHWGYAYIDNFCGDCAGSPEGNFGFNAGASSGCGVGQLCFDYTLPLKKTPGAPDLTGTIEISLDILQNGVVVASLISPVLTSGTSYCFPIDPAVIGGIDPSLGGFDFVANGDFRIGTTTLAPMTVGMAPDGLQTGQNNDYQVDCKAFSYAVKYVCGTQSACDCACSPVLPGAYATEINIYNHTDQAADIVKYVVPVVFAGAAAGREPRTVAARAEDRITLPAYSATMDDCCRINELLLGAPGGQTPMPLNIGFLEIVSPVELTVTAVYTAGAADGGPISIEVEQIEGKPRKAPPKSPAAGSGSGAGSGGGCGCGGSSPSTPPPPAATGSVPASR